MGSVARHWNSGAQKLRLGAEIDLVGWSSHVRVGLVILSHEYFRDDGGVESPNTVDVGERREVIPGDVDGLE